MGRLKTYDRQDVARKAMQSFWTNGFHAMSTKQLAADMGVNVYSLFAEFQNKQGLFEAALDVYSQDVVSAIVADLNLPGAGLKEIKEIIAYHGSAALCPDVARGCFYANTAAERGPDDAVSRKKYGAHIACVHRALQQALQNAQDAGVIRPDVSCKDQGAVLVNAFQGISAQVRARVDPNIIIATVRGLQDNVERLRK